MLSGIHYCGTMECSLSYFFLFWINNNLFVIKKPIKLQTLLLNHVCLNENIEVFN